MKRQRNKRPQTLVRGLVRWKTVLLTALASLLLSVPLVSVLAQTSPDSLAMLFTLPTLEGKMLSLESMLNGKLTIVILWATWGKDSSCVLEELDRIYQKYHSRGLEVVGVCVDSQSITMDDKQRIIDSVKRKNLTFPVVLDDSLKTFRGYSVIAVPTSFVISKERKILYKLSGFPIVGQDEFINLVVEKFEGKRPALPKVERTHIPGKDALRIFNMARVNHERGLIDLAIKYADKARVLDSLYAEPYVLLADAAVEDHRLSEADSLAALAMKLEPRLVETRRLHGLLLAKQGKANEAVALLAELVKSDSTSLLTHAYFGYALGMNGEEARALQEFSRAESLSGSDYHIPLLRAEVYERGGKKLEAEAERSKVKHLIKSQ